MPYVTDEEVEAAVNSFDSIGWAVRGCEIAVRQALEAAANVRLKRERLEALRAARDQWQPIESAPRDGKSVLVAFDQGGPRPAVRVARWWGGELWQAESGAAIHSKALAWMPMPAPPPSPPAR